MILELDCGNSFIKWRVLDQAGVFNSGLVGAPNELIAALALLPKGALRSARMVSVRSDEETSSLVALLSERFGVVTLCAHPTEVAGGVRNGYVDYARLGLDRWMAVLGAYRLAGGACLVLDLGTAVTSDFVDGSGDHLGGFICPGLPLMRSQLRTHTRRIRYEDDAAQEAMQALVPGRSTIEAVERGCSLMLRGFVQTQLEMAREYWGDSFSVFLTGGDAGSVKEILPAARVMPDLIFLGLAIACPLP